MSAAVGRLVLAGAVGVFVVGTGLGARLAFSSGAPPEPEATCEVKRIETGENLTSNLVTVHVFNASKQQGLANRVRTNLERRAFLGGLAQNNPGAIKASNVTVLTSDPSDPQVRLVAAQFNGKVATAPADFATEKEGVSLLVGTDFKGLKKDAPTAIKVDRPVSVCLPTVTLP